MNKKATARMIAIVMAVLVCTSFSFANTEDVSAVSKPGTPKITSVKATSTSAIKVTWGKVKGAKGYQVYRGKKLIRKTTSTSISEGKLKAGTKYTYKVRAYKTYKQKQWYNKKSKKWVTKKPKKRNRGKKRYVTKYLYGKFSTAKSATTKKPAAAKPALNPLEVTGLKAEMGYITAKLTWNAAPQAERYRVSLNGEEQGVTEACAYDLSDLTPATSYTVTVTAENESGAGAPVTGTYSTTKPPTPANIKTSSTTTSITITWDAVVGAESYYINSTDSSLKRSVDTNSYTIDGLTSNTEYTFYVQAVIAGKYGDKLDGKVVIKTKKEGFQAPTNIKVSTITSKTAVLTWDAVAGADSYQICDENKNVIDTVTDRTYMLKGLKENTAQTFYVTAGKSGTYGIIDDENKAQFSTIATPRSFTKNSNISLTYKGVKFYLGDAWNDTLLGKLKAASNGYEKVERPKFVYDGDTLSNATLHMFDINDYSDFLSVLVVNKKIVRWDTNGDVFGMYYGTEVRWGDVMSRYMFGKNTSYRTAACNAILTELDMGDTVVGGFAFYLSLNPYELKIDSEKRIGLHYVNAFRVAANLVPFEYSDALDGHNYTWSGRDANGKLWPAGTRYGAQPFAETVAASNATGHATGSMPNGPCAGQTGSDRDAILEAATGVARDQENEASGWVGECFLTGFQGSDAHFASVVCPGFTKIGFGMCDGIVTELFAY